MAAAAHESHELFTAPFVSLAERNRTLLERALRATQEQTLEFLNRNLERNVRTLERLRDCEGLSGLMAVEHEWFADIMRDSFEQTQRVAKLWWRIAEQEMDTQAEAAHDASKSQAAALGRNGRAQKSNEHRAAA
jgi:hypothetical protein